MQHDFPCRPSRSRSRSIALHRSLTLGPTRRRLRKAESLRQEHEVSQQEVLWFFSLPEKVRQKQFSREEQVLLAGRCDQTPPLKEHVRTGHSRTEHPRTEHPRKEHVRIEPVRAQQRFDGFHFGFYDDSDTTLQRGRSRRRSRSISPTRVSFDKHEQEEDTGPDESLIHLDTMGPPISYQGPPSFRRTLSLTNMPTRHSTSSAPPMADPPLFSFGPQWHQRSTSASHSGRRSSHTPTAPVFDPEATHYRDPEARKKLRMFLASPQKFDEAVEFGFPSTAGDDTITPRYQLPPIKTDARNFSRDMQTFLRDDTVSFLDADEDEDDVKSESDGASATDLESPITPSSIGMSFRYHTRHSPSNFSSVDSTGLPPFQPMQGRLNREMTLRMTLTRPDLRADEDQLYGWQGQRGSKDDPFALEELHLSDDMTGSKGAFAVKPKPHGNLVSRLFKRASKKGR